MKNTQLKRYSSFEGVLHLVKLKQYVSLLSLTLTLLSLVGCIEDSGQGQSDPNSDPNEQDSLLNTEETDQNDQNSMSDATVTDMCLPAENCIDAGNELECDTTAEIIDCENPACIEHPSCLISTICLTENVITLEAEEPYIGLVSSADDWSQGSCGGDGPEAVFLFRPNTEGPWCITTEDSAGDTVLYLRTDCQEESSEVACNDDAMDIRAGLNVDLNEETDYFVFVDHFSQENVGEIRLLARFGSCDEERPERVDENCQMTGDEDENGFADCDDRACLEEAMCAQPLEPTTCQEDTLISIETWGSVTGTTEGLPDEIHGRCGGQASGEQVYRFSPPSDGPFCVSTAGSEFDTLLHVRKRCDQPESEMGCNDDYFHLRAALTVEGQAVNDYFVTVEGYRGEGRYTLTFSEGECPPAPEELCDVPGDEDFDGREGCEDFDCRFEEECITEIPLACDPSQLSTLSEGEVLIGSNEEAPSDLRGSCAGVGREVVYRFDPTETGTYCIKTEGSEYDTVLYVRRQCYQPDSEVVCNDDFNDRTAAVTLEANVEETYYVILDTFRDEIGSHSLTIEEGPCIADQERCFRPGDEDANGLEGCDDPACAELPECAPPLVCSDNELVPLSALGEETGEIPERESETRGSCGGTRSETVYTFSLEGDSPICISVDSPEFDPVIYVRTDCGDPDSEVACNDDFIGSSSALTLNAQANTNYYLFVDSFQGTGSYTLDVSVGTCPPAILPERCDLEGDEDLNGLADCDDPACAETLECLMPIGSLACDDRALVNLSLSMPYLGDTFTSPEGEEGSCGGSSTEVAHTFTATMTGEICASLDFSNFDARLYSRSTCTEADSELGCVEADELGQASLTMSVTAGETYFFFVDGETFGAYLLAVREGACR